MLEAPLTRRALRARRESRTPFAHRAATFGVALGLAGLTALGAVTPAIAAQSPVSPTVSAAKGSATDTLLAISEQAQATLDAAHTALGVASTVEADIAASGLDVGVVDTSIDTDALQGAIDQLSALDLLPALMLPDITDATATETKQVLARSAVLRDRLDAAEAKKAAEEAAAKAAAEAQKAAEEAAAKAAADAAAVAAALAITNTPEGAQATAAQLASANYGWGSDEFSCLVSLWNKESGWNYQAYNDSSGATGIPQALPGSKMASAGSDWESNATTQIVWGLGYIASVYGSPCSAWSHSEATSWY
ncbi:hypothetical protein SAMN04487846_2982 [Microbacterium sp. cf046]|uniref:aggregation-promoting factor C-terminal-like domain-containing protein n=1 Tax=Microbacterium sp. cf046 TaxID=1761803 RepID=UPI0008ED0853|nr:phospholipase [Microbacterium sp. cf046]SFS14758.1 hypothetical protein SAMN04487846_2982 [Microbacterium sp. cf046]